MNEYTLGLITSLKLFLIVLCSTLYWIGGRANKIIRRLGVSLLLIGGTIGFSLWQKSFHWLYILSFIHCFIALSLGYGGDNIKIKLKRRLIYSIALGLIGIWIVLFSGKWIVLGVQLLFSVLASLIFGLLNPTKAVEEEAIICTVSIFLVPFMI